MRISDWSSDVCSSDLLFYATPRIDNWDLKAEYGFDMAAGPARSAADTDDGGAIDPAKVIDITARLDADGTLRWTPPAGRWTVVRFGHTTTGHLNVSASDSDRKSTRLNSSH